ncbi:MAG TPA: ABC transporter ATP-binding protein [Dermatophilaceae bacterium]|nr:ABC transporter ATP-binding protein [Dermatophilaceae bacterium]
MPAELRVAGLTWQPVGRSKPVLNGIDLVVPAGQRVLLAGPSGSGKSTLLRALAGVLQGNHNGRYGGSVARPAPAGLLLQDPSDALVTRRAGRDVAFGLENAGVPRRQMWERVRAVLAAVRFPYGTEHLVARLSGGERQRLALAGVVALRPGLLLLDEPTSMLDPANAAAVRAAVLEAAAAAGATTVLVEHHLTPWLAAADRLVVLDRDGRVGADGPAGSTLAELGAALAAQGVWVPGLDPPSPVDVDRALVSAFAAGPVNLSAHQVGVRHGPRWALSGVDADLASGRLVALTGPSGAGKSTLVQVLGGLLRPTTGEVVASPGLRRGLDRPAYRWGSADLARRVGWVPQEAEHTIVRHTVAEELQVTGRVLGRDPAWLAARVGGLAETMGLSGLLDANPHTLSGGEQRRLAVVTALAHGPDVLLADEPTVGQDRLTWAAVTGLLGAARDAGCAVGLATHDRLAVAAMADEVVRLDAGRVTGGPAPGAPVSVGGVPGSTAPAPRVTASTATASAAPASTARVPT